MRQLRSTAVHAAVVAWYHTFYINIVVRNNSRGTKVYCIPKKMVNFGSIPELANSKIW
eukprot:SAG11_NODE_15859_length_564_cov_1.092473_1_plen_58_part_00